MTDPEDSGTRTPAQSLGEMFEALGKAIGEIFDDPELQEKGREFGRSARESAEAFAGRFKDEEVRERFREVGKAAEDFGRSIGDLFGGGRKQRDQREP